MHWETTKFAGLAFLPHSLYCPVLELSLSISAMCRGRERRLCPKQQLLCWDSDGGSLLAWGSAEMGRHWRRNAESALWGVGCRGKPRRRRGQERLCGTWEKEQQRRKMDVVRGRQLAGATSWSQRETVGSGAHMEGGA